MEITKNELNKIGPIPQGWDVIKLGKIGEFKNGINKDKDQFGFGFPFVNLNDVFNFTTDSKNLSLVNSTTNEQKEYSLKEGDVLFIRSSVKPSGVGLTCVIEKDLENTVYSGFIIRYRSNGELEKEFKKHCFNEFGFRKWLIAKSTISANTNINQTALKSLILKLPPKPEQQKIGAILSTWDQAIEKTQQLIEQLKLRKKGLMQELLAGKKRLPGFDGEWKEYNLGDITKRITTKNEELDDTVVTISAQRGFVRQEEFFKKRVASSTLSGYYLIEKGDFAYNKSYSNGYPMGAFKRLDDFDKAVVTTLYICFSIKENADSDFLLKYFEGGLLVRNIRRIAQEGGRAHGLLNIGISDFFNLRLTLPPKDEQIAIARVLNSIDEEIKLHQKKLRQLKNQKKGLMQELLTGKKRVKI
ncbi:restriction endonuclease subunit S [Salinimicrobium sediminilitoris]|uniref:restriction endonuclease subunit S n=1 Tax=Salinimicrobium sediminilitoris TaxID=2876715 RepID=UPI001E61C2DD|nr:restriction endonuclease subunit S [Salinimicrobium sediminilitoris]MCC8360262.1 restriction endonuclease subunit S [Salinimicrobium sediminilitoris]